MTYFENIAAADVEREARDLGYRIGWLFENSQGVEAARAVARLIEGAAIVRAEGKPVEIDTAFQRLEAANVLHGLLEKARRADRDLAARSIGARPGPTPYDTGARLEPITWVRHAYAVPPADWYGRVDFDDDEGATIVTAYAERDGDGYTLYVENEAERVRVEVHGE